MLTQPFENFLVEHNILYKDDGQGNKLLYVPIQMSKEIIRQPHEDGHFGTKKLEELLSRDYFIPEMRIKIEQVRMNCVRCILSERKSGKQEGFLNPIPKNEKPLDIYHVDHLGPMASTNKNYCLLKICLDLPVQTYIGLRSNLEA